MRFLNHLAVACLVAVSAVVQAEPVSGLYQGREPIEGQGSEARAQATGKALDTLVLRLTGDPKAAQSPALAALRKARYAIGIAYGEEKQAALLGALRGKHINSLVTDRATAEYLVQ